MNTNKDLPSPLFHYRLSTMDPGDLDLRRGTARKVTHLGRSGIVLDDVFGAVCLGPHNLADTSGSLAFWMMPMEDLHTAQKLDQHNLNVPDADEFTLLSDRETVKDSRASHFSIVWSSYWHPSFFVKRFPGHIYLAYRTPQKAAATAGHLSFKKGTWYQIVYSWNTAENRHRLFVNGILVGHNDATLRTQVEVSTPGPELFFGSSMFAIGDVSGYGQELGTGECEALFLSGATQLDRDLQSQLEKTYWGRGLQKLAMPTDSGWKCEWDLPLNEAGDLRHFLVQGCPQAPQITAEGLRITTPGENPRHDFSILDLNHVYLWSRAWFEGDLQISYEFKNCRCGDLSLLMTQCSGMQREDFWKSHKPRSNGIMKTVCWEDVRNYHWEYLREMDNVRNDVASHALLKNPWHRALGFQVHGPLYPMDTWLKLDYL